MGRKLGLVLALFCLPVRAEFNPSHILRSTIAAGLRALRPQHQDLIRDTWMKSRTKFPCLDKIKARAERGEKISPVFVYGEDHGARVCRQVNASLVDAAERGAIALGREGRKTTEPRSEDEKYRLEKDAPHHLSLMLIYHYYVDTKRVSAYDADRGYYALGNVFFLPGLMEPLLAEMFSEDERTLLFLRLKGKDTSLYPRIVGRALQEKIEDPRMRKRFLGLLRDRAIGFAKEIEQSGDKSLKAPPGFARELSLSMGTGNPEEADFTLIEYRNELMLDAFAAEYCAALEKGLEYHFVVGNAHAPGVRQAIRKAFEDAMPAKDATALVRQVDLLDSHHYVTDLQAGGAEDLARLEDKPLGLELDRFKKPYVSMVKNGLRYTLVLHAPPETIVGPDRRPIPRGALTIVGNEVGKLSPAKYQELLEGFKAEIKTKYKDDPAIAPLLKELGHLG